MTNGKKIKKAKDRSEAFDSFCSSFKYCRDCSLYHCADEGECRYAWLDLEYNEKEELKPCPLCGHTDIQKLKNSTGGVWYISCNRCGCRTRGDVIKAMAIEAWNRRAK